MIKTVGELRDHLAAYPAGAQVSVEASGGQFRFITVVTDVGEGRSAILRTQQNGSGAGQDDTGQEERDG